MNRTPQEWAAVSTAMVMAGSPAQAMNVLLMALDDIAALTMDRDEHLRLKNKLVLAAYPAIDAVDAIRAWCDAQKYGNDAITVSLLRDMLPPVRTASAKDSVERSPRHYDSQGYCDNPSRGY